MPETTLEKAARALIADEYDGGQWTGDQIEAAIADDWNNDRRRAAAIRRVLAVLQAIRTPDEAMHRAMSGVSLFASCGDCTTTVHLMHYPEEGWDDTSAVWTAAIDAIISQKLND